MKGLWDLSTRTIDPGLGVAVFDALVAFLVTSSMVTLISRRSKLWPEARLLNIGMGLLSIYFVLHWIDVVVHHSRATVKYSYVLLGCFFNVIRIFSDIFVLWGTWRVLIRYHHLRPTLKDTDSLLYTTGVIVLLWFLALYQVCLLFALSFTWLSFSDLDTINAIAKARSGYEVAFAAVQFCSTIATALWASDMMFLSPSTSPYYNEKACSAIASTALLYRSFCEVVIVGQLDRWPAHIQTIDRARDVTYGLFSVGFAAFAIFMVPPNTSEDALLKKEETVAEEVAAWVVSRLEEVTEGGKRTAPSISTLLDTLERSLGPRSNSSNPDDSSDMKRKEIRRLKAEYANWEPIYKWQEESAAILARDEIHRIVDSNVFEGC